MDDPAADLVFTINSDGTLQATGKLQGIYSTMSAFYVDLSKAVLSPAEYEHKRNNIIKRGCAVI